MTMVWRAPLMFEPEGRHFLMQISLIMKKVLFFCQQFGMAGGRHVLGSCARLCFARTSSCEARAPFAGSILGI